MRRRSRDGCRRRGWARRNDIRSNSRNRDLGRIGGGRDRKINIGRSWFGSRNGRRGWPASGCRSLSRRGTFDFHGDWGWCGLARTIRVDRGTGWGWFILASGTGWGWAVPANHSAWDGGGRSGGAPFRQALVYFSIGYVPQIRRWRGFRTGCSDHTAGGEAQKQHGCQGK